MLKSRRSAGVVREGTLEGVHIVVTRPARQARELCALIEQQGGTAHPVPVLEIKGPRDPQAVEDIAGRLGTFDTLVFISRNAVTCGLDVLTKEGGLPDGTRVAAVGRATAEALERQGVAVDIEAAPPYNSESLLAAASLHSLEGRRILIIRGEGGRELLADTLRARGAHVEYAEVYRRACPSTSLAAALPAQVRTSIDAIVVTSSEGLANLWSMAGDKLQKWLRDRQLVLISERTAARAQALGFGPVPLVAREASDRAIVEAVVAWRCARGHNA